MDSRAAWVAWRVRPHNRLDFFRGIHHLLELSRKHQPVRMVTFFPRQHSRGKNPSQFASVLNPWARARNPWRRLPISDLQGWASHGPIETVSNSLQRNGAVLKIFMIVFVQFDSSNSQSWITVNLSN